MLQGYNGFSLWSGTVCACVCIACAYRRRLSSYGSSGTVQQKDCWKIGLNFTQTCEPSGADMTADLCSPDYPLNKVGMRAKFENRGFKGKKHLRFFGTHNRYIIAEKDAPFNCLSLSDDLNENPEGVQSTKRVENDKLIFRSTQGGNMKDCLIFYEDCEDNYKSCVFYTNALRNGHESEQDPTKQDSQSLYVNAAEARLGDDRELVLTGDKETFVPNWYRTTWWLESSSDGARDATLKDCRKPSSSCECTPSKYD
eukprot:TRINITY_DN9917_c0_g1_i1.p1 TRINITY_DN9917_c0_g1~~TRINITY_DN9917_c0_g1_i1.p1  ORF type:complete len:255 (+),score=16.85 TRINITY_DN9917_c0_g1_i1:35-799(+)